MRSPRFGKLPLLALAVWHHHDNLPLSHSNSTPWSIPCSHLAACGIFIDRDPASTSLNAKAHGRVDMLITCCKLLLSLVAALTMGTAFSPTVLIVVACLVSLMQLYATVCYQPLFNVEWNKINGGLAAVFTWASASTLIASQRDRPDDQVGVHPLCVLPCSPFTSRCRPAPTRSPPQPPPPHSLAANCGSCAHL